MYPNFKKRTNRKVVVAATTRNIAKKKKKLNGVTETIYRTYDPSSLKNAISFYNEKKRNKSLNSIKEIAEEYGVPRKTLSNHIHNPVQPFTSGRTPTISEEEKKGLVTGNIYYINIYLFI